MGIFSFSVSSSVKTPLTAIANSNLFRDWRNRYNTTPWLIRQVYVLGVHMLQDRIHCMWLQAKVESPDGDIKTEYFQLSGHKVDMLAIMFAGDTRQEYVVLVEEFQPAVGQYVISNPTGFIEDAACRAIAPEAAQPTVFDKINRKLGMTVDWSGMARLNHIATGSNGTFLVMPSSSDADITFVVVRATLSSQLIEKLQESTKGTPYHVVERSKARAYLTRNGRADLSATTSLLLYEEFLRS